LDAHGAKSTLTSFQEAGFDDLESVVRARLDDGMLKRIGLTTLKVRKSVSNALQKLSEQADADRMAALQEEEAAAAKAAALDDKERAERVAEAAEKRARDMRQRASVGNDLAAARGAALANPSLRAAGDALSFPPMAMPKAIPPPGTLPQSGNEMFPPRRCVPIPCPPSFGRVESTDSPEDDVDSMPSGNTPPMGAAPSPTSPSRLGSATPLSCVLVLPSPDRTPRCLPQAGWITGRADAIGTLCDFGASELTRGAARGSYCRRRHRGRRR